ncbi:hypothetical protein NL676_024046 [Syzygium grande]|nr:hypothetical protein NL676_024046 [Syzygium grande]
MGIGQRGNELIDAKDAEKSIRKKIRRKLRSCLWLCFSCMEFDSVVQEAEQKANSVLERKTCLLMCCSGFVVKKKG